MPRFRFNKYEFFLRNADVEGSGGDGGGDSNTGNQGGADNGGAGGQGGADSGADDNANIQKLIEKAVADAVAGLKKKNEEVIGANKKLKEQLTALQAKPSLSDEEYTEFKTLKERLERDEMLRLMAEGKSEEVIDRVTKKTRLDAEAKLAAEAEARAKREAEANEWKARYEQTLIDVEVAKAAATAAVKPQYSGVINKMVAERVKLIDGAVRIVNEDGEVEMTANGAKPLTVTDYIETLRGAYGDLFVASSGGGAGGSSRKTAGTSTKISLEAAETLPIEDYMRLRAEGKI